MFSKSCDDLGVGLDNNLAGIENPSDFFVDNGHLGASGNKSYVDEFKKLFLFDDIE